MNKRIVPLLLSIVMMCSLLVSAVPAWAEPADSGVSASVTQASPGETFSVTLKVPGTTKPINEMSLKVNFNKAVFEVTEYTAPAITGMNSMQSNLSEANSHGFFSATYRSISTDADVELTGLELTAKFKVKDGAAAGEQQFTIGEDVSVGSLDSSGLPDILMRKADFAKQFVAVKVVAAPKPATDISLSKSELTLTAGESASLTATVTPEGSTDTVVWSSSKTDVATVDATGKVTAVAPGEATITATAGTKTATCTVKVQAAPCEHGSIRIEVPFKLTVKKTGEMDPGKETFKFVVERFGAPVEYVLVQDTIETNGEKTYEGKFIFTIGANQAGNLSEGFVIRQVKGNAEGWTYDETKFYAMPMFADTYTNVAGWRFLKYDENAELDYNNPIEEISFTNSYNAKKPVTPPAPQEPEPPKSPKTGDSSMMGLSIALVIVSGAALMGTALYSRRKSR